MTKENTPKENTPKVQTTSPMQEFLGNLFHVSYNVRCRRDGIPEIHQTRDTGAFNDLRGPIERLGYEWESEMMLYENLGEESAVPARNDPSEFWVVEEGDCLVLTTRPPISDANKKIRGRSFIRPSDSFLEEQIFDAVRPYISVCSRKVVKLNPKFLAQYQQESKCQFPLFAEMNFAQNNDARLSSVRPVGYKKPKSFDFPGSSYSTIGFFLNLPELPGRGCQFFAAWGQGGKETAAWCRILRKRFPEWFTQPRFAMVEITFDYVPYYPLTLQYADSAHVHVHLDHIIESSPVVARKQA